MRPIVNLIGVLAIVGGIIFGALAYLEPSKYDMTGVSAIQATQVYAMAQHYAALGILCFLFAIAVLLSGLSISNNQSTA